MFYLIESPVGIAILKHSNNSTILLEKLTFNNTLEASNTLNALNNNELPENLKNLIKNNCPISSKIYVLNPSLCEKITKECSVTAICESNSIFKEIRNNIFKYFNISEKEYKIAISKLAYKMVETDRNDMILIDIINNIEELEVSINNRIMRIREWYSIHFPELSNNVLDNVLYLNYLIKIGNRHDFIKNNCNNDLNNINGDLNNFNSHCNSENNISNNNENNNVTNNTSNNNVTNNTSNNNVTNINSTNNTTTDNINSTNNNIGNINTSNVVGWARISMGTDINDNDIKNIKNNAIDILKDLDHKNNMLSLLKKRAQEFFPNLYNLAGENLTAKLIRKAGSISELAQLPSSTIQIFGSEKAYNEALNSKSNTPKYGFIYNHSFICTSPDEIKGKIARVFSNKLALCSRIDSNGEKEGEFGKKMKNEIERFIEKLLDVEKKNKKSVVSKKRKIISVKDYDLSRDSKLSKFN